MKCTTKLASCAGSHFVLEEVLIEHVGRVSLVFWVSHSIFIVGRMSRYGVHVPRLGNALFSVLIGLLLFIFVQYNAATPCHFVWEGAAMFLIAILAIASLFAFPSCQVVCFFIF
ncbi:hypothetical protein BDE02_08G122900 [Populus trichocarpa]|jgi:hypothetical protein|nr:hypothetical protein BDE02_08G122900 [Populus trichocarpa]